MDIKLRWPKAIDSSTSYTTSIKNLKAPAVKEALTNFTVLL